MLVIWMTQVVNTIFVVVGRNASARGAEALLPNKFVRVNNFRRDEVIDRQMIDGETEIQIKRDD